MKNRSGAQHAALAATIVLVLGCTNRASPPRGHLAAYDLSGPPAWRVALPDKLREISGLALSPDGRLFAHGDEEATVFELDPRAGRVLKSFSLVTTRQEPDLGKKARDGRVAGDFEGLAIAHDRFFLVTSNGVLVEFAEGADGASVPYTAHRTGLGDICEVEGLAHDPSGNALLLLCKQVRSTAYLGGIVIYAWSIAQRRLEPEPRIAVPFAAVARMTGGRAFNGSGLAFTPGGRSLVLVAGPQRLFAEITPDGRLVEGGQLDRTALTQPEGVEFLKDGTLVITSEGGRGAAATLSAFSSRSRT
jgi:uncharacterized protein YjiK